MPYPEERIRQIIADKAALLMIENGIADYAAAKRKAMRMLGINRKEASLPGNVEIDTALQTYLSLYREDERKASCRVLRRIAVELMDILQPFCPYLTGAALSGHTTRFSGIDLLLYTDTSKDVEFFLLDRNLPYKHETPRDERVEAILHLTWQETEVRLIIAPLREERVQPHHSEGCLRKRARINSVRDLLRDDV